MFSGIVQTLGRVDEVKREADGSGILRIAAKDWQESFALGESIAVNGVCLTLTSVEEGVFRFDLLDETFKKTNLGDRVPGDPVNLERSLKVGDLIGGHFVSGHVDGVGVTESVTEVGRDWIWRVKTTPEMLQGMVPKGSISCDGISLTLVDLTEDAFTVHIIPHTWEKTTVHIARPGYRVNLELDMLGKYVKRCFEAMKPGP
ncbi:MAG TPA: riboflavin synthase [Kiritimatiellia bacterium]|nr:riboflavin synthase [Kiritimatiellia bacterium]